MRRVRSEWLLLLEFVVGNRFWVDWLGIDDCGVERIGDSLALGVENVGLVQQVQERDVDEWSRSSVDGQVEECLLVVIMVFGSGKYVCGRMDDDAVEKD